MDETHPSETPLPSDTPLAPAVPKSVSSPGGRFGYWAKRLLACNPFYLLSAALLLYGCYHISIEPGVVQRNTFHLFFNFGSLELYEALLVATAILLAGRRIWYDSTLLIGLENMLLFVPFILISHGALIGQGAVERSLMWKLCGLAAGLAAVRLTAARRLFRELNFPARAFVTGLAFLLLNITLPVVFRSLQETKVGFKLESGLAYWTNEWIWLLVVPAFVLLALLVPLGPAKGEIWPQRHWLPAGMISLWLAGTTAHLYSLDYIYDYDLRGELLAPLLVVLSWILRRRGPEIFPAITPTGRVALLVLPFLGIFPAVSPAPNKVFLCLTLLNAILYSAVAVHERDNRLAFHLLLLSLGAVIAGFPADWGARVLPGFNRPECLAGAAAAYVLFWTLRSSNPLFGMFGGAVAGLVVGFAFGSAHWGLQAGLVVVLLHSIGWPDEEYMAARWLRILGATLWVTHSLLWVHVNGAFWMTLTSATPVLVGCVIARWLRGGWPSLILPAAAGLVLIARPAHGGAERLQTFSTGFLIVIASFILFGIGTVAALLRHRRNSRLSGQVAQ